MDKITEKILRKRMHGLYLTRRCGDIKRLSHELLGLHCWFHRNVAFSALIRGAELSGWKTALIKTWLYRGTLHGVAEEDLPTLLALHWERSYREDCDGKERLEEITDRVVELLEDGVYSRVEMRRIFAEDYDKQTIDAALSPWGGVFVELARSGKVAFRDMSSRDFDLIDAEPTKSFSEILPELLERYLEAYGPATIDDAAWFFGLQGEKKKELTALKHDYPQMGYNGKVYYYIDQSEETGEIPELTLLSGFDPLIVSYLERSAVLPPEYKSAVILKSGICLPAVAVRGQVAGIWNIKSNGPTVEFFTEQPKRIRDAAFDWVEDIYRQTRQKI